MSVKSAGILPYRLTANGGLQVFLAHLGGPYWAKKDYRAWTFPKGEFSEDEEPFEAAIREFNEETGFEIRGEFMELTPLRQPSRKLVFTWAVEADFDPSNLSSNEFEMEWPPKSGQYQTFPEVDRAEWFSIPEAEKRVFKGLVPILEELVSKLGVIIEDEDEDEDPQGSLF